LFCRYLCCFRADFAHESAQILFGRTWCLYPRCHGNPVAPPSNLQSLRSRRCTRASIDPRTETSLTLALSVASISGPQPPSRPLFPSLSSQFPPTPFSRFPGFHAEHPLPWLCYWEVFITAVVVNIKSYHLPS
jgi:hypothetical protein